MERAAGSAAEYGQRTLETYSLEGGRINDRLAGLSDEAIRLDERRLHEQLQKIPPEAAQTDLSYVLDRGEFPLLSSRLSPVPKDTALKDRDYFQTLSGPAPPPVYVSKTFLGRFDGRLLFTVARPRRETGNLPTPDGFDGVVLVSVRPVVLADGMRRLLSEPTDRMALIREDGFVISTTTGPLDAGQPLPQVDPASPFHDLAERRALTGVSVSTTAIPGTSTLLAMHRLDSFPIYAASIRPRAEIVSRWMGIVAGQLGFGISATLALFVLSLGVVRSQSQLAAANTQLQRDNDLSSDRLVRSERFGLVGTFEFDVRTGVSRRSPEYMSIQGLPAAPATETHDDWACRLHPTTGRALKLS